MPAPMADLIAQLDVLGRDTGVDLDGLHDSVVELTDTLTTAVPSFLAVTVTPPGATCVLTLAAVAAADRPARTSLGFSLPQRGGHPTRLTLYAAQPGALVDLDADLSYLLRHASDRPDGGERTATDIRLDQDLPAPTLVPGLTGLDEQATLDRAEGALIDHGVHPDQATDQLRRRAATAGLDPHPYARRLLAGLLQER